MRQSVRIYSNKLVKRVNRGRILNILRLKAPISRAEIADLTGLDRKSITNFVDEFLAEELIYETGVRLNDRGPSSIMLEFVPDSRHFIGVSLHADHARALDLTLPGKVGPVLRQQYPPDAASAGSGAVAEAVGSLIARLSAGCPGRLVGVGVAVPGIIDAAAGVVRRAVNIPLLEGVRMTDLLPAAVGLETRFENSARAKAVAEKWFGLGRGKSNFTCIDLASGVGCGIIHDRRMFRSPGDFVGEIGHLVVEPGGRLCACGNRGCLEAYVGEKALLAILDEAGCLGPDGAIRDPDSPEAREVFRQAGVWLGRGLAFLVNILNPPTIILNGPLMRHSEAVLPQLWATLKQFSLSECSKSLEILPSTLEDSDTLGAACLVMADMFEVPGHYYV